MIISETEELLEGAVLGGADVALLREISSMSMKVVETKEQMQSKFVGSTECPLNYAQSITEMKFRVCKHIQKIYFFYEYLEYKDTFLI